MATRQLRQAPNSSSLYDVLDLILDKGIVIDAYVRVSLVGIELLTVDARVVIASVDTFLRYAEAMDQLGMNVNERFEATRLPEMVHDGVTDHAIERGKEKVKDAVSGEGNGRSTSGSVGKGVRAAAKAAGAAALAMGAEKVAEKFAQRRQAEPDEEAPDEWDEDEGVLEAHEDEEEPEEREPPKKRRQRRRQE